MRLVSLADLLARARDGRRRVAVALPAADLRLVAAPDMLASAMDQDARALAWQAGDRQGFLVTDVAGDAEVTLAEGIWRAGVVVVGNQGPVQRLARLDLAAPEESRPIGLLPRWARAVVDLHRLRPTWSGRVEARWDASAELLLQRQDALLRYVERMIDESAPEGTSRVASLASGLDMLGWLPRWHVRPRC